MEKAEAEKSCNSSEDTGQLSRNRSFKSKQLVRSQAIRESQSPPRSAPPSPAVAPDDVNDVTNVTSNAANTVTSNAIDDGVDNETRTPASDASSHASDDRCSDVISYSEKMSDCIDECKMRQQVEIQITPGAWEPDAQSGQRARTQRWLGLKQHSSRDLLSNHPRVACVCGACTACPHCRGRRRKRMCPTKQDSGIVCSDDCPDCSDSEPTGGSNADGTKKTGSVEAEEHTFYCRCPERKEKPKSISLSRTDSEDKSEPTGQELVNFIKETLNKNARDRMTLLKIEKELHSLVNDTGRCIVRFPVMTSYGRMLVHRCASLFQLSHHLDQTNKTSVLVSKSGTSGGRLPCTSFKQWCTVTFPPSPQRHVPDTHAKSILKRATHSLDEPGAGGANAARSKSLEQREREYERVRRRIFSSDNCTQGESQWPWLSSGQVKVLTPEAGRNKLLKVQSLEVAGGASWRGARGAVSKSHSFGGYAASQPHQPRLLSRQGDLASNSWRLSPSSSGYRTLSLHSTDSVTPSPTGGASPEPCGGAEGVAVVWAVTDMSAVPPGAIVIHPQSGRALTNADGSVYHFDPHNPPVLCDGYAPPEHKIDQNCEKKRGRLEKQHSFIDNESECQVSEECRNKCCCECRRQQRNTEQITTPQEHATNANPTSPSKTRYDQPVDTTTNHNAPVDQPTNHRPPYEATTNHNVLPDQPTNHRPPYEAPTIQKPALETNQNYSPSPNQRPAFESRQYETTNLRQEQRYENQRQMSFDGQKYESTIQRAQKEATNYRSDKLTNQDSVEVQYMGQQSYQQVFRHDEMTSPPQASLAHTYLQTEMVNMQHMSQAKLTPVPISDPNMRAMSLTNMVYPAPLQQAYPYINQCRMEPSLPPSLYQQLAPPAEDKQLAPSPHANEATFRIDPSYPYAPVDYSAQCGACAGACADPNLQHHHHRAFNMAYGQVEVPATAMPPAYSINNVMLPQHHLQQYPYQEQLQWQNLQPMVPVGGNPPKMLLHELYPIMQYPNVFPHYNIMYPQMVPAPYPLCQPVYAEKQAAAPPAPVYQRHSKRNSISGSARTTPLQTPPDDKKVPYDPESVSTHQASNPHPARDNPAISRQNSNEIAAKIQQIKEQMAALNVREGRGRGGAGTGGEWRRRNSGTGILGSCPAGNCGQQRATGRPGNDDAQLTSAARAIVTSIRNMHVNKNNYQHERRGDWQTQPRGERAEQGRRRENASGPPEERRDARGRGLAPFQYRPPYLLRQMSPGTWCRRSPGPIHPVLNHPRRPHPDTRNTRR